MDSTPPIDTTTGEPPEDEDGNVQETEQDARLPVFPWRFVTPAPDPRVKRPRNPRQAPQ